MKLHFCAALGLAAAAAAAAADEFDWNTITPSHDLEYHDCYDSFHCARLLLPLDWLDESSNETVALALLKSDAVVGIDDATYAGPVLSNPGGPGGSGVDYLRGAVAKMRDMVDTPGKKHFEFVSFDPRGVGRTTPQVDCYPEGRLPRSAAIWKARGSGGVSGGPGSLPYMLGLETIQGNRCGECNGDLLRYVGTTSVARDMLAVVEKIDEYNAKHSKGGRKAERGHQMQRRGGGSSGTEEAQTNLPRLQYLGFSYGTVLGNYFASMFPERIGRVLLDGVADIDDYGWLTNTVDTDEMADLFFQGCFDAGHDVCPLHRSGDRSGADISRRFWDWVDGLDQSPFFVTKKDRAAAAAAAAAAAVVLQSRDLRTLLLGAMYEPLTLFKELASLVDATMRGNTTALYDLVAPMSGGSFEEACPVVGGGGGSDSGSGGGGNWSASADDFPDAQSAVLCGDGEDITGRDTAFWRAYVAKQLAQSSVAGAYWSDIRLACSSWRARAKWQFRGPFTTPAPSDNASSATEEEQEQEPQPQPQPGRPAAPVLFLSTRLDPVTPLRAARKAAQMYPGAGLLVQDAMGHCVFSAHPPTDCTRAVVRRYFDEGVVPSGETTCEAVCTPWSNCESAKRSVGILGSEGGRRRNWRFPLHI
ncbi:putative hydrolase [Beauveria bassiana]|uniref:Putative hydrolase n=1 Tax=Beauveria bassiana TaxID=176275 RepID=A0A2N6NAT6_BEABA|nr:putative hydrolase [Beauveria bassiana]